MGKAEDIWNGWKNYVVEGDPAVMEIAKQRVAICAKCPLATFGKRLSVLPDYTFGEIQGYYCDKKQGGCGCPLSTAVRSKTKKCPLGKW